VRIGITLRSYGASFGGPGTYTEQVLHHLLQLDRLNEYVLIFPNRPGIETSPLFPDRPNVREVHTRSGAGLWWDEVVVPMVARRHRIDVLFSPFPALPSWGPFRKVMTVLGAERYVVPEILDWRTRAKWIVMEKLMLPAADRVISLSETMTRDFCRATGFPASRVATAYLGVDSRFRRIEDQKALADIRRRYSLDKEFVLFVGHLFPNKNLTNLLRGFRRVADGLPHDLLIVGGKRWKVENIEALVAELGLEGRVKSLGFVSTEHLILLYNLAACFVFPSLYESFGLAQLEAMACGCPVVASKTGALPEIAGDAAVFCDPYDPASIGEAIRCLASNETMRRDYAGRALARAKLFNWERCAQQTLAVLQELKHSGN
jgi:glycosyltransferase involved in cell wall biosynthesis